MQKLKAPAANRVTIQAAARLWWINMVTVAYLNGYHDNATGPTEQPEQNQ